MKPPGSIHQCDRRIRTPTGVRVGQAVFAFYSFHADYVGAEVVKLGRLNVVVRVRHPLRARDVDVTVRVGRRDEWLLFADETDARREKLRRQRVEHARALHALRRAADRVRRARRAVERSEDDLGIGP